MRDYSHPSNVALERLAATAYNAHHRRPTSTGTAVLYNHYLPNCCDNFQSSGMTFHPSKPSSVLDSRGRTTVYSVRGGQKYNYTGDRTVNHGAKKGGRHAAKALCALPCASDDRANSRCEQSKETFLPITQV